MNRELGDVMNRKFDVTVPRESLYRCLNIARYHAPEWHVETRVDDDVCVFTFTCQKVPDVFGVWERGENFVAAVGVPADALVRFVPDSRPKCATCGTNRHKKVYLVPSENDVLNWKGLSCLDSKGQQTINGSHDLTLVDTIKDVGHKTMSGPRHGTLEIIAQSFAVINESDVGFVSNSKAASLDANSTAAEVWRRLSYPDFSGENNAEKFMLAAAIAQSWIQSYTPTCDFEAEVKYAASLPTASYTSCGLLCFVPILYRRNEIKVDAEKAGRPAPSDDYTPEWFGVVGERSTVRVQVDQVRLLETYWMVKMRTEDNLCLVWFTGKPAMREGDTVTIAATVKAHKTFKGEKSTQVNRCRVVAH